MLADWKIERVNQMCFQYIDIRSPDGYVARVASHDRNPEIVLYKLANDILNQRELLTSAPCLTDDADHQHNQQG